MLKRLQTLETSGRLFHTLITLHEKKYTLTLLHLGLYNLYACSLIFETKEISKKHQSLILQARSTFHTSTSAKLNELWLSLLSCTCLCVFFSYFCRDVSASLANKRTHYFPHSRGINATFVCHYRGFAAVTAVF